MLRSIDDTGAALRVHAADRPRFESGSQKFVLEKLSARIARRVHRPPTTARQPRAIVAGVALVLLGIAGHAVFRTVFSSNAFAAITWLVALAGSLAIARSYDSDSVVDDRPVFRNRGEVWVFVLILGLTAALRLWHLGEVPATVHGDSAECGIQALDILRGKVGDVFEFSPWYYTPYPAHLPYVASFALLGTTVLALRLPSAFFGILCMVPLYFLVRSWLGVRAARICTTLFALSHPAIHFSRIGLWNIQSLFVVTATIALIALAVQKRSSVLAACAGIAAGLGFYTYTGGRLAIILVATFLMLQLILGPRRRLLIVGACVVTGFTVAITPLVVSYARSPDVLEADRTNSVFIFSKNVRPHVESTTGATDLGGILRVQTLRTLRGFWDEPDRSGQSGIRLALVSRMTALLALAGVFIALAGFRRPTNRLILLWAGLGLLLGSILIIDPPSHTRLVVLFPVPFIFSTLAIETAFRWLEWRWAPRVGLVVIVACLLVIGRAAMFNLNGYERFAERVDEEAHTWDIIQIVHTYGADDDYYVFGGPGMYASAPPLRLFARKCRLVTIVSPVDIPQVLERDTVFIIPLFLPESQDRLRHIGSIITERFPNSARRLIGNEGEPQFVVYEALRLGPSRLARDEMTYQTNEENRREN